eukprot:TRINITY_DN2913_c0_g1_i6.p2 TRINITY_DN2913_c0_g1~~TRINITY_DN2913_c0_g1_i6.p2  ORF type:complete len:457 (-),score=193.71 TRINITY_DN2913_c0_g1_i6:2471-3841(-)
MPLQRASAQQQQQHEASSAALPLTAPEVSALLDAAVRSAEHSIGTRLEAAVARHIADLYTRLEQERVEREAVDRQRQERLLAVVAQTLSGTVTAHTDKIASALGTQLDTSLAAVGARLDVLTRDTVPCAVRDALVEAQPQMVAKALAPALAPILDSQLVKPLQKNLDKTLLQVPGRVEASLKEALGKQFSPAGPFTSELARRLQTAVQPGVDQALVHHVQSSLLPALEQATQQIGAQLRDAFGSASAMRAEVNSGPAEQQQQQLVDEVRQAAAALHSASGQLQAAQQQLLSAVEQLNQLHHHQHHQHHHQHRAAAEAVRDPAERVNELIRANKIADAFAVALGAKSVPLVVELCQQLSPSSVFGLEPPLPPLVVLSLVQQLSVDLLHDTPLKLEWLSEAVMALDMKDAVVATHVGMVLSKLLSNLQDNLGRFSSTPLAKQFKVLMHVTNSFLSSAT